MLWRCSHALRVNIVYLYSAHYCYAMENVRRYVCSAIHDAAPGMTLQSKLIAVFSMRQRTDRVALRFLLVISVLDSAAGHPSLCSAAPSMNSDRL